MPKPCSLELRERVVEAIASGASRREAAEWFAVSPSSAIKWMQRQQETGSGLRVGEAFAAIVGVPRKVALNFMGQTEIELVP